MTDKPKPLRAPKNLEQATELLERVARLDGDAARIGAQRDLAIVSANAAADAQIAPLVEQRAALAVVLEAWWRAAGKALLKGRRKTAELAGVKIGLKAAPIALTFGNSDDFKVAVEQLREQRWAKPYVRVSYAVDKDEVKGALDGKHGEQLRALGFGRRGGADVFVLQPVAQTAAVEVAG